jgi:hypothetical protein
LDNLVSSSGLSFEIIHCLIQNTHIM